MCGVGYGVDKRGFAVVLIALAQGMNIDMIDNFTNNILQLVIISAEI